MRVLQVLLSFIYILQWANGEHFTVTGKNRFFDNKALSQLIGIMNYKTDPCTDYYEYVCGNWRDEHMAVEYNSAMCMTEAESNAELYKAITTMNSRNKTGFEINVMDYVNTCYKVDYNISKFIDAFEKLEGISWFDPKPEYNWPSLLAIMRSYGMNDVFLTENIYHYDEAGLERYISVAKATSDNRNYTKFDPKIETVFKNMPIGYFSYIVMKEITVFNDKLIEIQNISTETNKNVTTLNNLTLKWIETYLTNMLKKTDTTINPLFGVILEDLEYFQMLENLLDSYDDELIYKYLQLQFLIYLDTSVIDDTLQLSCVQMVRKNLPLATDWIYELLHPEVVEEFPKVYKVFENVHKQVKKSFSLDESGIITDAVLEKLNNVQMKIGILPRINTLEALEDLHRDLETNEVDFYENHLRVLYFNFERLHTINPSVLTTNVSLYVDVSPPIGKCQEVVMYYDNNLIILPVTLLRQPYYHWSYSDFSVYSTLGVRIIREILTSLELDIGSDETEIIEIAALHIALETFFSNLPEEYKDKDIIEAMEQVFILKASQYFCNDDSNAYMPKLINKFIHQSSRFSKIFHCKTNDIIDIFAH